MLRCFVLLHRSLITFDIIIRKMFVLFDIPITNAQNKVKNVKEKAQPKIIDDVIQ